MAATDMTQGNAGTHLLSYSIPLVLGNLFQLAYNAVDSMIVGQFLGKDALAAVGNAGPVMNLVILGISGICIGASVLMSEMYGAGKTELLKKELSTVLILGMWFCLAVTVLGIGFSGWMMTMLRTPEKAWGQAVVYLRIIFLGAPFTFIYNALAAGLKSMGDSKTPLRFLIASSVLNGALDLILIGVFHMGITCSAATTVVAEAVSALLCIWYIRRKIPLLRLSRKEFLVDSGLLKKTLRYGSITAFQQACQPVGKLLIQRAVNPLGVDVAAAFAAVNRVDDFAFTPEQSISHGITIFVAQNRGAGNWKRIDQGFFAGLCLELAYWMIIGLAILLFREPVMSLFVSGESAQNREVIAAGCQYLGMMALFYLLPGLTNGFQGYFRGMGNMSMTLLGTAVQTSLRVVCAYALTPSMGISGVAAACAAGWSVMLAVEIPFYFRSRKKK